MLKGGEHTIYSQHSYPRKKYEMFRLSPLNKFIHMIILWLASYEADCALKRNISNIKKLSEVHIKIALTQLMISYGGLLRNITGNKLY